MLGGGVWSGPALLQSSDVSLGLSLLLLLSQTEGQGGGGGGGGGLVEVLGVRWRSLVQTSAPAEL